MSPTLTASNTQALLKSVRPLQNYESSTASPFRLQTVARWSVAEPLETAHRDAIIIIGRGRAVLVVVAVIVVVVAAVTATADAAARAHDRPAAVVTADAAAVHVHARPVGTEGADCDSINNRKHQLPDCDFSPTPLPARRHLLRGFPTRTALNRLEASPPRT